MSYRNKSNSKMSSQEKVANILELTNFDPAKIHFMTGTKQKNTRYLISDQSHGKLFIKSTVLDAKYGIELDKHDKYQLKIYVEKENPKESVVTFVKKIKELQEKIIEIAIKESWLNGLSAQEVRNGFDPILKPEPCDAKYVSFIRLNVHSDGLVIEDIGDKILFSSDETTLLPKVVPKNSRVYCILNINSVYFLPDKWGCTVNLQKCFVSAPKVGVPIFAQGKLSAADKADF